MDAFLLVLRVGLSLGAVLGLLWWLSRRLQSGGRAQRREALAVLGRQPLTKRSGVALIEVAGRRLVVGYADEGVSLLHDAGEAPEPEPEPEASDFEADLARALGDQPGLPAEPAHPTPARMADVRGQRSPLDGSILAPDTWRKAVVALQDRTIRRS
ncbi:FliO/MopB family protein [Demequina mangrovi]|uniref:Flagellar biosynthetic protein FliO n=1 Tax=Demequina mangrovi TaxID=1043493 RepID=A0A1H6ZR84_9MICO|nr:flagellar biosynthetic protein FliO [Demequina mangrovi]SEJ55959.1 flagellar biosynthetic protein FliO [Demequina mangrovi]